MKKVKYLYLLMFLSTLILFERCQPIGDQLALKPTKTSRKNDANARVVVSVESYQVEFDEPVYPSQAAATARIAATSIPEGATTSVWSYTVTRIGVLNCLPLNRFILSLGGCTAPENVVGASIDGAPYGDLAFNSGESTICNAPGNIMLFNNVPDSLFDYPGESHVFSFTLNIAVGASLSGSTWVQAGETNDSQATCESAVIPAPGCFEVDGTILRTDCVSGQPVTSPYENVTVTLSNNGQTVTNASGAYSFTEVIGGAYVVSIATPTPYASITPGLSQTVNLAPYSASANFTVTNFTGECKPNGGGTGGNGGGPGGGGPGGGGPGSGDGSCSYSQGYWFSKPGIIWTGSVTVAGFSYTQTEGSAIWNVPNTKGIHDAKKGFLQVAAIKLSKVSSSATVWADVVVVEAYLAGLGKLDPSRLVSKSSNAYPSNPAAAAAAGRIGQWIEDHHCD